MSATCDTCRFRGCKRCDVCSRHYQDRYEPVPPPKPVKKGDALLALCAMTLLNQSASEYLNGGNGA